MRNIREIVSILKNFKKNEISEYFDVNLKVSG